MAKSGSTNNISPSNSPATSASAKCPTPTKNPNPRSPLATSLANICHANVGAQRPSRSCQPLPQTIIRGRPPPRPSKCCAQTPHLATTSRHPATRSALVRCAERNPSQNRSPLSGERGAGGEVSFGGAISTEGHAVKQKLLGRRNLASWVLGLRRNGWSPNGSASPFAPVARSGWCSSGLPAVARWSLSSPVPEQFDSDREAAESITHPQNPANPFLHTLHKGTSEVAGVGVRGQRPTLVILSSTSPARGANSSSRRTCRSETIHSHQRPRLSRDHSRAEQNARQTRPPLVSARTSRAVHPHQPPPPLLPRHRPIAAKMSPARLLPHQRRLRHQPRAHQHVRQLLRFPITCRQFA